jgi:hypothetical protein
MFQSTLSALPMVPYTNEPSILTITGEMISVPTTEKYILFNEDTITGIPIIFKHKGGVLRISSRYEQPHLINSLLADLFVLHEPRVNLLPVDRRVSGVIYELYNFWCFNIVNTDNLSINVCTDIKNIISIIIQKQNTLYKRCNTQEVIDELRRRLSIETTISDTVRSTKSLNLRRF